MLRFCSIIKRVTGLSLDYVKSAGGREGTSTYGRQGQGVFSDHLIPVIRELLSKACNSKHQQTLHALHKKSSIILKSYLLHQKDQSLWGTLQGNYVEHCQQFSLAILSHTLHGAIQQSAELIKMGEKV